VADNRNPESAACLDQCLSEASAAESTDDPDDVKRSKGRAKQVAKCARRCPGVERRPNQSCAAPIEGEVSQCRNYVHEEAIREANPVGIVAVSLAAAAVITISVLCIVSLSTGGTCGIDTR
jgi:hypothetical protein